MKNSFFFFVVATFCSALGLLWLFLDQSLNISIPDPNLKKLHPHLLYEETFEDPTHFDFVWKQFPAIHSFQISSNPVFRGKHSGRFELRHGDKIATKTGVRSEVLFPEQRHRERWYSFAVFFPVGGFEKDNDTEIFTQWHQEQMGSPSASFNIKNDRLVFIVGSVPNVGSGKKENIDLGEVPKDSWQEFVFHFIHSDKSDGLIEIWKNGEKILTKPGGNIYPGILPKWKIGIYKWTWEKTKTNVDKRFLYFDNVRMGNEKSSLEDLISIKPNIANATALEKPQQSQHQETLYGIEKHGGIY